jgi:hypothetical protein
MSFSDATKSKLRAAGGMSRGFAATLASWDETDVETLPPALVKPAAIKCGPLGMDVHSLDLAALDLTSLSSGLTKLTTGTLDTLTMGATDKLLDEVGAGDLSDTFKHRWVVLWRHPDLTRGPYQLIWYESERAKFPSGNIELTRGSVKITNPVKLKKGHSFAFELHVTYDEDDEDFHASFSAPTFDEKVSWMNMLEDYNAEEEFVDNEDIQRFGTLPKMHHLNYDQLPAEALYDTAQKAGYIHKQGKGGSQAFKKRWFVLWHHPASVEDGWAWLWYADKDAAVPNGYKMLHVGQCAYTQQSVDFWETTRVEQKRLRGFS